MEFSKTSRVWVYQSNRAFNDQEQTAIQHELNTFIEHWLAHGNALLAKAEIIYKTFIVLTVDERQHMATGCSIDSSVRMIKGLENKYNLDLFNRFNLSYKDNNQVIVVNKETFETLLQNGTIHSETIVFNNMIQTLEEFESNWEVPMHKSWHNQVFTELMQ